MSVAIDNGPVTLEAVKPINNEPAVVMTPESNGHAHKEDNPSVADEATAISKPEDAKPEEAKPEDDKTEDAKPEDSKTESVKESEPVVKVVKLTPTNRCVIVTGAESGVGFEVVKQLCQPIEGVACDVVMACSDMERAGRQLDKLKKSLAHAAIPTIMEVI